MMAECLDVSDDLQAAFSSHAEYHLSQQLGTATGNQTSITDLEQNPETSPSNYESKLAQNVKTEIQDSMKSEESHNAITDNDQDENYFGGEVGSYCIGEIDNTAVKLAENKYQYVPTSSADIGLPETSLEHFTNHDFTPVDGQTPTVIPVELKKCSVPEKSLENDSFKTDKVTTLMDSFSIGELKRLWTKADTVLKKSKITKPAVNEQMKSKAAAQGDPYTLTSKETNHVAIESSKSKTSSSIETKSSKSKTSSSIETKSLKSKASIPVISKPLKSKATNQIVAEPLKSKAVNEKLKSKILYSTDIRPGTSKETTPKISNPISSAIASSEPIKSTSVVSESNKSSGAKLAVSEKKKSEMPIKNKIGPKTKKLFKKKSESTPASKSRITETESKSPHGISEPVSSRVLQLPVSETQTPEMKQSKVNLDPVISLDNIDKNSDTELSNETMKEKLISNNAATPVKKKIGPKTKMLFKKSIKSIPNKSQITEKDEKVMPSNVATPVKHKIGPKSKMLIKKSLQSSPTSEIRITEKKMDKSVNKSAKQDENQLNCKTKQNNKQCSIQLQRVDKMDLSGENLKVDMKFHKGYPEDYVTKTVMAKMTKTIIKEKDKQSAVAMQKVIRFVANSVLKCERKKLDNSMKEKLKKLQEKMSASKPRQAKITETVTEKTKSNNENDKIKSKVNSVDTKIENEEDDAENMSHDFDDDSDFDINAEMDDKSEPSEDEFKPKKTLDLSKAFTNCKSRKSKKSKRRKLGTLRIGRPPVLGHFECKHCDFTACELNIVQRHSTKMHGRVNLPCRFCDQVFHAQRTLMEHEAYKHTNEKPFKCEFDGCEYASKNHTDLQRHQSMHATEKKYKCNLCDWTTKWIRNIRSHKLMKHTTERKFQCTVCSFTTKRNTDLKQHMYRHSTVKPISCLVCGFCVKTNWELRSHMLIHSSEKPFKCDHPGCIAATKTNSDLLKHKRQVHEQERNVKCPLCDKAYKNQQALNKHHSYIHTTARLFNCDNCGRSFKCKQALRKHMAIHTGIKPHACSVCDKAFFNRSNMEKHKRTHDTTTRKYKCPLCPYAAKEAAHLLPHIGSFHRDSYTYYCELCKKPFSRYGQLQIHYGRMHAKEMNTLGKRKQVDLALLKMEMKLDLERTESDRKRQKKSNSKEIVDGVEIKQEPIDEEFDCNDDDISKKGLEDITDVRLNEETGQIEVVKKRKGKSGRKVGRVGSVDEKVNENKEKTTPMVMDIEGDSNETEKEAAPDADTEQFYDTEIEQMETEQIEKDMELKEVIEKELNKGKTVYNKDFIRGSYLFKKINKMAENSEIVIQSNSTATVASYGGFRLPLATKGFDFNHQKNGKKPKIRAWYMDTQFMNRTAAAKMNKYLRRMGKLPALRRGRYANSSSKASQGLTTFLKERKKRRNVSIHKSNFIKGIGLVASKKSSRESRFQGDYSEFENLEGEDLTVGQVREILPSKESPLKMVIKKSPNKVKALKKDANKLETAGNGQTSKSTKQKNKVGKKPSKKKHVKKPTKLLLSTEKQKKTKPSAKNIKIRKPKYVKGDEADETEIEFKVEPIERNSFAALENIIHEEMGTNDNLTPTVVKTSPANKKSKNIKAKKQNVGSKNTKTAKPKPDTKYSKKYIPVKSPKKSTAKKSKASDQNTQKVTKAKETKQKTPTKPKKLKLDVAKITNTAVKPKKADVNMKKPGPKKSKTDLNTIEKPKKSRGRPKKVVEEALPINRAIQEIHVISVDETPTTVHRAIENSQFVVVYPPSSENPIETSFNKNLGDSSFEDEGSSVFKLIDNSNMKCEVFQSQDEAQEEDCVDDNDDCDMDSSMDMKTENGCEMLITEADTGVVHGTVVMDTSGDTDTDLMQEEYLADVKHEPTL